MLAAPKLRRRRVVVIGLALVVAGCGDGGDSTGFDTMRACRVADRLVTAIVDENHSEVRREIERLARLPDIDESDVDVEAIDSLTDAELNGSVADDVISEFGVLDDCEIDADGEEG